MAIQPTPPITSTTALDKEGLSKLKRPEIQALCKANNLRAIGTTGSLIDSLSSYFESLALSKPDKNAHVTSKPVSRLRKVLSPKPPFRTAQDPPPPPPVPEPTVLPNGTAVKSKPSLESLSAKPGVRKPSLRIPPTRSRLSSSASLTPMVIETSVEACTADEPSALPDPLFLSPASAAPTPRSVVSPTPSNRSLSSSVRPVRKLGDSTNTKPRTIVTTSKTTAKTTSTQSFPTSNLSNSTSTKPSSAPIRRSSLTPSITSQARSPPLTRPRLSSHASPGPSPIRNMQTEVAELAASLKAVEDARVDQIAALTERIAAQDLALQAQNDLVNALQQTVREMHELLVSTRQDVLEACKVDVASCVSQSTILTEAVADLQQRLGVVEVEVFDEGGRMDVFGREMGDVDVAMASERDRVSCLENRIGELEVKVDEVTGESTVPTSSSSASFRMRKNSKKLSMSGPGIVRQRKQSVVRDSADNSPQDSSDLFSRDRRLSRASISASLHTSTPLSPVPSSAVAFPSTTKRASIRPPFSGTKQEFKFPPPPVPKVTESRSRTISATARKTKTPEPYSTLAEPHPFVGKALLRTPPAYGDEGEEDDDPDPQSPVDEDGQDERTMRLDTHLLEHREEESSEDERVTPPVQPRPTRTSTTKRIGPPVSTTITASTTTRTLPSILVNNEKPAENSNSSSLASVLSDGAVSVSISDLDVAGGMTTDDDGGMKRRSPQVHELHDSLLHQPQPSFGGLTTDDEFDDGAEDEMSHTVILSTVPLVRKKSFRT